jgi:hypothetical protein
MATAQLQSTSDEVGVRTAIELSMKGRGGVTVENQPGRLVMDLGGAVGKAYLAGGFRDKMKMPMRLEVLTAAGEGGTGVTLEVRSRGTGGGFMSGGLLGSIKEGKAEQVWLDAAVGSVPARVG